jgi:hypothetical protein
MRACPTRLVAWSLVATLVACLEPARSAATVTPALARVTEHCWWSTNRTALPPDSVTARFQRAFAALGFTGIARASGGDTAWVQTSPTALSSTPPERSYAMHAVAYAAGDSTRYRYFLSAVGAAAADDTAQGAVIPLCTAVARAAAIPGVQPAQPTGEETATVWRWRLKREESGACGLT